MRLRLNLMIDSPELEAAIWSVVDGRGSADDLARLHADERASLVVLDRLIIDVEDDLASARSLVGDERDQVVADLAETLDSLRGAVARLRRPITPSPPERQPAEPILSDEVEPGEVELQASWTSGQVVVWASGRGATPESHDDLSTRLEAIGGPPLGWLLRPGVQLPGGLRADALAIPVKDALGWLVGWVVATAGPASARGCCGSATSHSKRFAWRRPGRSCRLCVCHNAVRANS